jgi:hypothetical protein
MQDNNPEDWEILTDTGWKSFRGIIKNENVLSLKLKFDDGTELICSEDHELQCINGQFTTAKKSRYKKIKSIDGFKIVKSIKRNGKIDAYDVTGVDGSRYITNDVVSHNCNLLEEFWASVYPIISSSKKSKIILASTPRDTSGLFFKLYDGSVKKTNNWVALRIPWNEVPGRDEQWKKDTIASLGDISIWRREFEIEFDEIGESTFDNELFEQMKSNTTKPLYVFEDNHYFLWETPNEERIYVAGVDPAEGLGRDASVIQILDITDLRNIKQVALYHNNKISPSEFTTKSHEILQHWGSPLALIERNGCGGQVVDNLKKNFNYENIVSYGYKDAAQKNRLLGIMSHTNTKYRAIINQRYWVNTMKAVRINDINTVNEFKDFIRLKNGTWGAKSGSNDDRVMAFIWALLILSDDLIENYFEIIQRDENNKPLLIRPMDYGIRNFVNPISLYANEKEGGNSSVLPILFEGNKNGNKNPDYDELYGMGWKPLNDINNSNW